jgi:type I restriction enzyme R subunit
MSKESYSRLKINKLLEESGWILIDTPEQKKNVDTEPNVKYGNGGDGGFIDYLLFDKKGFPLVVIEAKKEERDPLVGKEQARTYAMNIKARFIILSNGNIHYLWDIQSGNPRVINVFPTQETLIGYEEYKPKKELIINENVDSDYIVQTQFPTYKNDPDYINEKSRDTFITNNKLCFLRDYQIKAINSIQNSIKEGNDRFLWEMATGTGKTATSAGIIKLFLRTENSKRVLFLVDRIELEEQAQKAFNNYLKNDYTCVIWKENKEDWKKAEIVVSTIQSFMHKNKYKRVFQPNDFDFVISDEAHRSIGGNSRSVFEYFIGYKLGLTATPKDYLKKLEKENISQNDPREYERRMILDTYHTFGCDSGNPTFRYSLLDGVKGGFLINPVVIDARTEITTQLLSDEGFTFKTQDDEGKDVEEVLGVRDFERKFYSDETNRIFCKTLLDNCLRDPVTGEVGKTLVFCVSQKHASKITQILNEFGDKMFPGKYNSDFAIQVTSNVDDSQRFTTNFTNNKLSGSGNFNEIYITSKTRICVTCSMMTTGYDCPDLLNVCLMKPVFSPSDFVQMKGRGTRKHNFFNEWIDKNNLPDKVEPNKVKFKLFDFFGNCEYFEEKFNYDEILELPKGKGKSKTPSDTPTISLDEYLNINPDPIVSLKESEIGYGGMKIDKMYFGHFEEQTKNDSTIVDLVENQDWEGLEEYLVKEKFEKPSEFYNLDKLRKSLDIDRRITIKELIQLVFGKIPFIKNKNQLLEEEFDKFDDRYLPSPNDYDTIKGFFQSYLTDAELRDIVESKKYGLLNTHPSGQFFKNTPEEFRKIIPDYIKNYVPLNKFVS